MPGEATEALDCGRRLGLYHRPKIAGRSRAIAERVQETSGAISMEGLEFIGTLDRNAIGGVIMAPSLASLAFVIIWLSIYLRKTEANDGKIDTQVVVTTAFTIAIYLLTAGEFLKMHAVFDHAC